MRVITGTARGRKLETVDGLDVRPTTSKVKEAVFSAIQFEIEGARVLDLFCGSGQMGIEALSRGAALCVFVDSARSSQDVTKRNLMTTGLFSSARVAAMDYKDFLRTTKEKFDIVFMDPPYSQGMAQDAMQLLVDKTWTGNIRELRNVMERLLILSGDRITADDVRAYVL